MSISLRSPWLGVVLAWLLVATIFGIHYLQNAETVPLLEDSDDAMRMVMVIDLLNGQAWQDPGVARDNTPFGGQMHWSRLVDAPLALLTKIGGLHFAAFLWPLLLILPALALTYAATRRLAPRAGIVIVTALFTLNLVVAVEFSPGRVDHHNFQIVLVEALLVALLLGRKSLGGGALAGLAAATCLAIGMETIVIVTAAGAALTLCWIVDPVAHRRGMVGFAAGFGLGALGHFLLATAPARYFVAACDALSIVYVVAAGLIGLAMAASALAVSGRSPAIRFATILGLGSLAAIITGALFPHCLGGPYAEIDPRMVREMFPTIGEAQPLFRAFINQPIAAWLYSGTAFISLGVALWRVLCTKSVERQDWLILLFMLAAACLVLALQLRGTRLTTVLAIPSGAWVISAAIHQLRPGVRRVAGVVAAILAFAPIAQALPIAILTAGEPAGPQVERQRRFEQCRLESSFAQLAALPPGRLVSDFATASHILRYTPHSVLSAGFHRNGESANLNMDFFGDEDRARTIARERELAYAVTCGHEEDFAARTWMQRIPGDGPIEIYRIDQVAIR